MDEMTTVIQLSCIKSYENEYRHSLIIGKQIMHKICPYKVKTRYSKVRRRRKKIHLFEKCLLPKERNHYINKYYLYYVPE